MSCVREAERRCEGLEPVKVRGRAVTKDAGQSERRLSSAQKCEYAAPRMVRRQTMENGEVAAQRICAEAVPAGGVGDVDQQPFLIWSVETKGLEPRRRAGRPAGGIDHCVRVQDLLGTVVRPTQQPHPSHGTCSGARREAQRVAAAQQVHARQPPHPRPHTAFDHSPTGADGHEARRRRPETMTAQVHTSVAEHIADQRSVFRQLVGDAGKEFFEQLLTPGQQRISVASLGHTSPGLDALG